MTATRIKVTTRRDRLAENVIAPAQRRRRRAFQTRLYQAKVVAVSWAQHQPMFAEADWAAAPVDRRMPQIEDRHSVYRPLASLSAMTNRPIQSPTDYETHEETLVAPNRRL